ncbi:MAG: tetratricopeptide repeat protein [Acidobacteria bacterium]|nr:tetratricopeptide repeat protein [Acidobacteriota bacterium]
MVEDRVARKMLIRSLFVLVLCWGSFPLIAQQLQPDWQEQIRQHVAAKDLAGALVIAERRLNETPTDLEARGWRARLLAWSNRWREAEREYLDVHRAAPDDLDIVLGLADVVAWQQRFDEALALLDQALQKNPQRADIYTRRGHWLRSQGRKEEAREAFREAMRIDPGNREAVAGLRSLEEEPPNEFRIGTDIDHFNFAENASSLMVSFRSRLAARWRTDLAGSFVNRFGQNAGRFLGSGSYLLTNTDTVTAGGGVSRHKGVIPKGEAFFEYSHAFRLPSQRGIRGMEAIYRQHWLWFRDARILALVPGVILYLPREWIWTFQVTVARSHFSTVGIEWRPSGTSRLRFPLHERLTADLFFSAGTENFAFADQIGRFSARTFGGGARIRLRSHQDTGIYVFYQDRSQGRTQTGFGVSYGISF